MRKSLTSSPETREDGRKERNSEVYITAKADDKNRKLEPRWSKTCNQ